MNDETKSARRRVWERWWYEPRHFFFLVVLLSPCVYVGVLLINSQTYSVVPLTHWIALAAILGILLGVPAFVMSWIPPIRRWFTRLLQHKFLVVASLATLIALFYAVENWRGRNAWNNFRREWQSRGVEFDPAKIMSPAVPTAENMYEAEPWRGFHSIKSKEGKITFERPGIHDEVWFDCTGPNYREAPESTDLILQRRVDLAAWQEFYRGTNNQFVSSGTLTNFFPVAPSPQTPAKDVLLALSRFDERYQQIQAAAQRPAARYWLNLEDGVGTLLPHLSRFKSIATYLRLHSAALMADGQTHAAFDDLMLSFRIGNALKDEPILISHLVRIAILQLNLGTVWEGLADHRWSDRELAALEAELARTDMLAEFHRGMAGERYFATWCVDYLHRTGDLEIIGGPAEPRSYDLGARLGAANSKIFLRVVPKGLFDQNKLSLCRMHMEYIVPLVDRERRLVSPEKSQRLAGSINSHSPRPYDLFSRILIPALQGAAKKAASAQAYVDLARVACALERYRLANGGYPETLEALSPRFVSRLPHDVINGEPLKYRRIGNSFKIYSVGWNVSDDGGDVAVTGGKNPRWDQSRGDWVWTYPLGAN